MLRSVAPFGLFTCLLYARFISGFTCYGILLVTHYHVNCCVGDCPMLAEQLLPLFTEHVMVRTLNCPPLTLSRQCL